ncbi:MAG TPA: pyridoxal-phosphate dependent enzyme, partial [Microthrixaceae bacterium]|nr:pyridoxal-phosphate dependent enzyme [Microthrixaceae bacterium]
AAAFALADQIEDRGIELGRIVVAASTAGTAAGLILGAAAAGLDAVVDIACVYEPADLTELALRSVMDSTAQRLGIDVPADDAWILSDEPLGGGYGVPTASGSAAIERVARSEGVLLDPVYTGKAMGNLIARIERGELDPDGAAVVFVHTGGSPGLFAYGPDPTA